MPRPPLPTLFDGLPADRPRSLPVIGEQKDIRYHATSARTLLNGPETTGMDPYTGCAKGRIKRHDVLMPVSCIDELKSCWVRRLHLAKPSDSL